jgi:hypothetical protein
VAEAAAWSTIPAAAEQQLLQVPALGYYSLPPVQPAVVQAAVAAWGSGAGGWSEQARASRCRRQSLVAPAVKRNKHGHPPAAAHTDSC